MKISLRFEGLDRLVDAVRVAPGAVHEVLDVSVLEAGEIIASRARLEHNFRTKSGMLERSVSVQQTGPAQAVVFLDRNVAPYAAMVHEGTRAQEDFVPTRRKALRWSSRGTFFFARRVSHPGTKPDQFLYKAADKERGAVQARIQAGIDSAIQEAGLK